MAAGIEIIEVTKKYASAPVLERVSLSIEEGEFLTLLGSSGSGKTTLLNIVAGLADPTSGDVRIRQQSVVGVPIHRRGIGLVFQRYSLFPHMSVAANVGYPLKLRGIRGAEYEDRVAKALSLVELQELGRRRPQELSGGQQQRTALARALIFEPSVLLLDEPFAALDRRLREQMKFELRRIHDTVGITTILVTHDQDEALALSDRIAVLDKGKLQQVGPPRDVYRNPRSKFIAQFMGETNVIEAKLARQLGKWIAVDGENRTVPLLPRDEFGDGGEITIGIRSEDIEFASSSRENAWSGNIEGISYLGNATRYLVQCGQSRFVVRLGSKDVSGEFKIGDAVALRWDPIAVQVLDIRR
jgi:putative spermidine/putrescine transport system ATP-binding protein